MDYLKLTTLADSTYVLYPAYVLQITVSAANLITAVDILDTADGTTTSVVLTNKRADLGMFTKKNGFNTILSSVASAT